MTPPSELSTHVTLRQGICSHQWVAVLAPAVATRVVDTPGAPPGPRVPPAPQGASVFRSIELRRCQLCGARQQAGGAAIVNQV